MAEHVPFIESSIEGLNNFLCHFSLDGNEHYPDGMYREKKKKFWDKSFLEMLENFYEVQAVHGSHTSQKKFEEILSRYSDRYLHKTSSDFYAEIDRTLVGLGFTVEGVAKKLNTFYIAQKKRGREPLDESLRRAIDIREYLRPIYNALRQSGYNPNDLVG